jgi:hypothetical protein
MSSLSSPGDGTTSIGRREARTVSFAALPEHARAAAQYLLENRLLVSQVSLVSEATAYEMDPEAASFTAEDIDLFLEFNAALRTVAMDFDRLDSANGAGIQDNHVTGSDLRAIADDLSAPDDLREPLARVRGEPEADASEPVRLPCVLVERDSVAPPP